MPTSPYLLHVNSQPLLVPKSVWIEWYTREQLPDLVNSKASTRATFYEEVVASPPSTIPSSSASEEASTSKTPRHFLAMYQTECEEPLTTEKYLQGVRRESTLFERASGKASNQENGDFDARNYSLVQDFDPTGLGDVTSPFLITVEMNAKNEDDFHGWYREEHLDMLARMPAYRRSQRYVLGPATALKQTEPAKFLAIHELDSLDGLAGAEAKAANETE